MPLIARFSSSPAPVGTSKEPSDIPNAFRKPCVGLQIPLALVLSTTGSEVTSSSAGPGYLFAELFLVQTSELAPQGI